MCNCVPKSICILLFRYSSVLLIFNWSCQYIELYNSSLCLSFSRLYVTSQCTVTLKRKLGNLSFQMLVVSCYPLYSFLLLYILSIYLSDYPKRFSLNSTPSTEYPWLLNTSITQYNSAFKGCYIPLHLYKIRRKKNKVPSKSSEAQKQHQFMYSTSEYDEPMYKFTVKKIVFNRKNSKAIKIVHRKKRYESFSAWIYLLWILGIIRIWLNFAVDEDVDNVYLYIYVRSTTACKKNRRKIYFAFVLSRHFCCYRRPAGVIER